MKANISKGARKGWAWILAALMVVSVIIPTTISTAKAEVGTVQFNGTALLSGRTTFAREPSAFHRYLQRSFLPS